METEAYTVNTVIMKPVYCGQTRCSERGAKKTEGTLYMK